MLVRSTNDGEDEHNTREGADVDDRVNEVKFRMGSGIDWLCN